MTVKAAPVEPPRLPGLARLSPLWTCRPTDGDGYVVVEDPTFHEVAAKLCRPARRTP